MRDREQEARRLLRVSSLLLAAAAASAALAGLMNGEWLASGIAALVAVGLLIARSRLSSGQP